jgi:DNA invertase Pin-like site-specific DNA recombinase
MTQAERDRLVALKKAKKKLITQKQAADELGITERHVRRLLRQLKRRGDKVVAHALRGLPSNRKISADTEQEAVMLNIMTAVSQWEREAIGERTRDAMRHKRNNGERVGNIPYGYRLAADGRHLEADPGEQAVLAEIRHLRWGGATLRGIAAALNHRAL